MKLVIVVSLLFCMNSFAENYVSSEMKNCQLSNTWDTPIDEKTMKALNDKGYVFIPPTSKLEIFNDPVRLHFSLTSIYGDPNLMASVKCGSWNQIDRVDIIRISIVQFDAFNGFTVVGSANEEMAVCSSYSIEQAEQEMEEVLNKVVNHLPDCKDL